MTRQGINLVDVRVISAGSQALSRSPGASGHRSESLRVFDAPEMPADAKALQVLASGVAGVDLAAPPVVLPDFHHKSNMEMPSSIAVATLGTIRPTFTSSSVNCGMALIALDGDRPTEDGVEAFYRAVRERYPYPTRGHRDLSYREVVDAAVQGGEFAVERYGVRAEELERVEEGGRLDLEKWGGGNRLRKEMPALTWQLARLRFGTVGPSNHFVELQQVEEIFDQEVAAQLGIRQGQMTIQYHAGGGVLTGEIGHLFARRQESARVMRMAMAFQKPLYHLGSARSLAQLRERMRLFFSQACPPVELDSQDGQRLMLANAAAMNYGYAFRMATYHALASLAVQIFGGLPGHLIVDSPHNSVYEEQVGGQGAVVHRHNSCRAYPADRMPAGTTFASTGQAVLLPGTHRTSSYLAVAAEASADSLYSACHGAGTVIEAFERSGVSQLDPLGRSTLRFRYSDAAPTRAAHLDDTGVNAALSVLTQHHIVRPVARMRPMAVLH